MALSQKALPGSTASGGSAGALGTSMGTGLYTCMDQTWQAGAWHLGVPDTEHKLNHVPRSRLAARHECAAYLGGDPVGGRLCEAVRLWLRRVDDQRGSHLEVGDKPLGAEH